MADVANKYEVHATYVTMKAASGIAYDATKANGSEHVGKAVMISGDDEVALVTDDKPVFGKLIKVEAGDFCTVQDGGYFDVDSEGSITYGAKVTGSTTAGKVKTADATYAAGDGNTAVAIKGDGANHIIVKL